MNNPSSSQNLSALFEELKKLKKSFSFDKENPEEEENEKKFYKKNSYLFATTSASLFRLLPDIPYSKHKSIFQKILLNIKLLDIEEQNAEIFSENFEVIDTENSLIKAQKGQPFLFCCFHTGAYSLIPALLASRNLDFGFLSNKTLTQRKEKIFFEAFRKYCENYKLNSTTQFINVEENKGIWKALRLLKGGNSLIVYADGNTGSNASKTDKQNTVKVNFLGENLLVRQGIAFLSYACQIPIVPLISNRIEDGSEFSLKRRYRFLPAIYPPNFETNSEVNLENKDFVQKENLSKEEFAVQTMQKLYSILENEIIKTSKGNQEDEQVSKWEGWIFVNKFFEDLRKPITKSISSIKESESIYSNEVITEKSNSDYIFNEERFALIEGKNNDKEDNKNQKNTLFDKFNYRFFPVSDLLYEVITYFSIPKKLYLLETDNKQDKKQDTSSHSPIPTDSFTNSSTNSDSTLTYSEIQLSKTLISVTALEKLIEKQILIKHQPN